MFDPAVELQEADQRDQVAFALACAAEMLPALATNAHGRNMARAALDVASGWVGGNDVSSERLVDLLFDEEDAGLIPFGQRLPDEATQRAWWVIETAVAFTAWSVARVANTHPAAILCNVHHGTLTLLRDQALDAGVSEQRLRHIATTILRGRASRDDTARANGGDGEE